MNKDIQEMIDRCNGELKPYIDEKLKDLRKIGIDRINKWNNDNRELLRELQKKYRQSEKGRASHNKTHKLRRSRILEQKKLLSEVELNEITQFYKNCPEGYHVDHIIPVCKGGRHHIDNLQYLTPIENWKKGVNY